MRLRAASLVALALVCAPACHRVTPSKEWPASMLTVTPEQTATRVRVAKGDVVVYMLYASWCSGCRAEIPNVERVAAPLAGKGLDVLAFSLDEDPADYDEMLADHTPKFPLMRVAPMKNTDLVLAVRELGGTYGESIPYTAVFDRQGKLVQEWKDGVSVEELQKTITPLL